MAGAILNRIPINARTFTFMVDPLWTSPDVSLGFSVDEQKHAGYGSITTTLVSNAATIKFNDGAISTSCVTTDLDLNYPVEFMCWYKSTSPSIVDVTISLYTPSNVLHSSSTRTVVVNSTEWTLVRTNELVVDDDTFDYRIVVTIEVSSPANPTIYVSAPAIIGTFDFVRNEFATDIWLTYIPEFLRDDDRAGSEPFSLVKFLDALTTVAGQIHSFAFSAAYVDISDGYSEEDDSSKSVFVDPDVADSAFLNYLSQFVGTKLVNPQTGSTPWVNLPTTWTGIDNIDLVSDDQVPWGQMELFDPEPAGLSDFLRWQVKYGYYGLNAGSKTAIVESVKRALSGTQNVQYSVLSSWQIEIETFLSETPNTDGLTIGDTVPELLALIEPARPLGVSINHVLA